MRSWLKALVVCAAVWAAAVGTAAAAKPPVVFVQDETISASCSVLAEKGVRVPIRNETSRRQKVRVALVLLRPDGRQVKGKAVCGGLAPSPRKLILRPGGGGAVTLRAANAVVKGTFIGSVAVFGRKGRVARRDLQIAEEAAPSPALAITPVVTSISAAIHSGDRGPFWVPVKGSNVELPVAVKGKGGDEPVPVGALTGPGGPVTVIYNGESKPLATGISQIGLDLEGDLSPGTYSGQVDLSPEDAEAGTLALEIKVSSEVWWAILALLIGIALGVTLLRISGRTLPRARLLGRVAGLTRRYRATLEALEAADGGSRSWNNTKLENLPQLQADLEAKIEEATSRWKVIVQIEKTVVENLEAAIAQVEAQIDLLAQVPHHARGLEAALQLPRPVPLPEPAEEKSSQGKPQLHVEAESLLAGGKVRAEELKQRLEEMDAKAKQIRLLRNLERRLAEMWKEVEAFKGEASLDTIRDGLEKCARQLWSATDTETLEEVDEQLRSAAENLAKWRADSKKPAANLEGFLQALATATGVTPPASTPPQEVATQLAGSVAVPAAAPPAAPPSPPPPPPPPLTDDAANRAVWRAIKVQVFVVLVVAALAVATGLEALYFGKTWGTLTDWLAAIVWGTAAQAVVTGLVTSLDNLGALAALRGGK